MSNRIVGLLLLAMLPVTLLEGQTADCIAEIWACQQGIYKVTAPNYTNTVSLQYEVAATHWDNTVDRSTVKMYRRGRQVRLFTDVVDLIQDHESVFLILNNENTIIKKSQVDASLSEGQLEGFKLFQKEYLESCKVVHCELLANGSKKLVLIAPSEDNAGLAIERIIYQYDPKNNKLLAVETFFKSGYKFRALKQEFKSLRGQSTYVFSASAIDYFFEPNGTLKRQFAKYQFIDYEN